MEADAGNSDKVVSKIEKGLAVARWAAKIWLGVDPSDLDKAVLAYLKRWYDDDVLAQRTVTWTPWDLAQGAPAVGSSVTEEIGYKGSANYTVTYRVTRVS